MNAILTGTKSINKKHILKRKKNIWEHNVETGVCTNIQDGQSVESLSDEYFDILADYTDSAEVQLNYVTILKNKSVLKMIWNILVLHLI